jgi:DNA sulfur modification protein DndE
MSIRSIRFSQTARDQLARLRRHTGIEHMNVLARWALCTSLAETIAPPASKVPADSNLEMTWEVFGGHYAEVLYVLVKQRCIEDGLGHDDEVVATQLRLHVHRGLAYLAGDRKLRSIADLVARTERVAA